MRCETCEYWIELDYPVKLDGIYGNGELARGRWGKCERAGKLGPSNHDNKFYAQDASDYNASLQTRSDFGCIEYQQKEVS